MYLDLFSFLTSILDRNDRMTMGASIECRVPFLDHRLLEGLAALPSRRLLRNYQSKALLRSAMNDRLPGQVQRHRKWGFSVPWETYLRQVPRLRQMVVDLPSLEPLASSPLDRGRLTHVVQTFLAGQPQYDLLVRQLFMIAAWHQAIFNGVRE
jgi:asparagine synthase (glutamine-hydrolysing)